ncbi:MAG: c-type cytochrome [Flavobacteriales bacterium]|nr:c-type cytochrome [Flavobacteriales bacterium]
MKNNLVYPVLLLAIIHLFGCSSKSEKPAEPEVAQTDQPAAVTGNAQKGQSLYVVCSTCHGPQADGMLALGAPALADQEPYYLHQQLQNFRTNKRGIHEKDVFGAQMAPMAKTLNGEGIDDVIAYIKTMPSPKVVPTMAGGDAENGKAYYNMICGACHGPGAVGIESLHSPRLVGLQDWYVERQLNNFRQGVRGTVDGDTYGAQMQQIALSIPDDKTVSDLIAYINSLSAE